ncbi:replication initiation protein [Pseudoalteromonas sp. SSM20]|uniref:replication initiation protein n=1 Tax=Pseudoalteromonas sp. SSM20 TaxID=3139394 RepID=UPI003BAA88C0
MQDSRSRLLSKDVDQSQAVVEAKYSISKDEQRILVLASQKGKIDKDGWFTIRVADYALAFDLTSNEASRDMRQAYNNFWSQSITVENGDGKELEFRWIQARERDRKLGTFGFQFTDKLLPYIQDLSERVSYPLKDVAQITNPIHMRLYGWLYGYLEVGELVLDLDYMKEKFVLSSMPAYAKFNNFKRRILDSAVEKINETTPIIVNYEPIKEGRKISKIRFIITEKPKATNCPS